MFQRGDALSLAAALIVAATTLLRLPLGLDVRVHPLPDELEGPLVLGDLEQLHGTDLTGGEAAHLAEHFPQVCTWSGSHSGCWASACQHAWSPCGPGGGP